MKPAPVWWPRFMAKVAIQPNGCWLWTANRYSDGYGQFKLNGRPQRAHRVAYEARIGPILDGLQLDHFRCDTPLCVHPEHVRPATNRENVLRGETIVAANLIKTHCPRGHSYDSANTYYRPSGRRGCRACHRESQKAYRARRAS